MKTLIAFVLTAFTALSLQAQQQNQKSLDQKTDTKWSLNRDAGVLEKIVTTKSIVDRVHFQIDPSLFTSAELLDLANGKIISHDDVDMKVGCYPVSISLPIISHPYTTAKTFRMINRTVVQTSGPHVLTEVYNDYPDTFTGIYAVGIGLLLLVLIFATDRDNNELTRFAISILLVLIGSFFAGYFLGIKIGTVFGAGAGAFFGQKRFRDIFDKKVSTFRFFVRGATGLFAGMFVGNSAGTISAFGGHLGDPAFFPVWQYIGYFFMASLVAIGARQILALIIQIEGIQKILAVISLRKKLKQSA